MSENVIGKQYNKVKELNINIKDLRLKIVKVEEEIKNRESDLWLHSNWPVLLEKDRPTEKDKTSFINSDHDLILAKRRFKKYKAELDFIKNEFDVEYSILKFLMED